MQTDPNERPGAGGDADAVMAARRKLAVDANRRPRFLVRRTTGKLGVIMKIEGKEIIARN